METILKTVKTKVGLCIHMNKKFLFHAFLRSHISFPNNNNHLRVVTVETKVQWKGDWKTSVVLWSKGTSDIIAHIAKEKSAVRNDKGSSRQNFNITISPQVDVVLSLSVALCLNYLFM